MSEVKRKFSAGGIVFKKKNGKTFWLVIQPKGGGHWSKGRWQFPKGWIEKSEKAEQAAQREVEEETGVRARVVEKIDNLRIFFYDEDKNRVLKTISLFLMAYQDQGQKKEDAEKIARIEWLPYNQVYKKLTFDTEKEALKRAKKILGEKQKQSKLF
jgi:bis(5'-nucleosidyl)-tetraphosphatase